MIILVVIILQKIIPVNKKRKATSLFPYFIFDDTDFFWRKSFYNSDNVCGACKENQQG